MSKPVYVICRDFEVKTAVMAELVQKKVITLVSDQKTNNKKLQYCVIGRYSTNRGTLLRLFKEAVSHGELD